MTVLGFIFIGLVQSSSLQPGNPNRLTNAVDSDGRICGIHPDVSNRPKAYYMSTGAAVCVSSCPNAVSYTNFICMDNYQKDADSSPFTAWDYVKQGRCMYHTKTNTIANRCICASNQGSVNSTVGTFASRYGISASNVPSTCSLVSGSDSSTAAAWLTNFIGDLWTLRGFVFGFGLGISVIVSFLYLYFLRIPGLLTFIIWTIIIAIEVVFVIIAVLLYQLAGSWKAAGVKSNTEVQFMFVCSYIMIAVCVLYFCLILVLAKRIALAIGIVKEAGRALGSMPLIILVPVFEVFAVVVFLIPWTIYVVYLLSSGEVTTSYTLTYSYKTFTYSTNTKYAFLYFLFCWFWTSQFVIAVGQLTIALSVVAWYFTRDKGGIGSGTVLWSFRTNFFHHLGTAAHGSLVIAIIQTIRAVIMYLQNKAKKSGNKIAQAVLCCIQCCMWCIESCMKFINKNAYIQTAIYGYSFCKAARTAFFLIVRNILRIAAVNMVSEFVLVLGRMLITAFTTLLLYLALAYSLPDSAVTGIIGSLIMSAILTYFVACMFCEIFGMCIETILLCYIADEELFEPEQRFAEGSLRSAVGHSGDVKQVQVKPKEAAGGGGMM